MANNDTDNCCVAGCRNKQNNSKLCFFTFPEDVERQTVWLRVIGRPDLLNKTNLAETDYRICSKHFTKSAKSEVIVRKLLEDAIPTKFLPTSPKLSLMQYQCEDDISDVATQTEITYGYDWGKVEEDVYVEIDGKQVLIKKEKDPEIPKLNTFVLERPVKREPGIDMEQCTSKKVKKRNI